MACDQSSLGVDVECRTVLHGTYKYTHAQHGYVLLLLLYSFLPSIHSIEKELLISFLFCADTLPPLLAGTFWRHVCLPKSNGKHKGLELFHHYKFFLSNLEDTPSPNLLRLEVIGFENSGLYYDCLSLYLHTVHHKPQKLSGSHNKQQLSLCSLLLRANAEPHRRLPTSNCCCCCCCCCCRY
jgi:hypothetical protein